MKARTFVEWLDDYEGHDKGLIDPMISNKIWTAAQDAMFEHADGELPLAVRVPPVGEWPDKAIHIRLTYTLPDGGSVTNLLDLPIPRPAPKWEPSIGDKVFVHEPLIPGGRVLVGRVTGMTYAGFTIRTIEYDTDIAMNVALLKPFDASAIGKPWSEI